MTFAFQLPFMLALIYNLYRKMLHQMYGHRSVRVADNLYAYIWQGRGNNCNTCLFVNVLRGDRPHVIVDPGHTKNEMGEPCFDSLTKTVEKDGFKISEIGLVINTHTHVDHCQANELITQHNGALLAISREEEEYYHQRSKLFSLFGSPGNLTPSFYLQEGTLNLGAQAKLELQALLAPGHSPGSVCLYWEKEKVLISGDVIFFGSVGRTDLPGGSTSLLKKSIDRLSQLDIECLIPGHSTEYGSIVKGKENVKRNFQAIKLFF